MILELVTCFLAELGSETFANNLMQMFSSKLGSETFPYQMEMFGKEFPLIKLV